MQRFLHPKTTAPSKRTFRPLRLAALVAAFFLVLASRPDAQSPEMATIIVELSSTTADARAAVREQVEAAAAMSNAGDADVARAQAVHRGIDRIWSGHVAAEKSTTALVSSLGGQRIRTLRSSGIVIYRAPLSALPAIQAHQGVRSAYVDQQMKASLGVATASMGCTGVLERRLDGRLRGRRSRRFRHIWRQRSVHAENQFDFLRRLPQLSRLPVDYADDWSTCDDFQGHGTGVAGMIFSQGTASFPNGRGTAFGLDKLYSLKAAYLNRMGVPA